ncbi:MAG: ATP-binding cassette domain-containing protein [Gammaproteobacteria bacterium]|nr:ATP-binding cassette domain-containing protein [Gammaproteobacteria bacterium]MBU1777340.1 ATP-binding cassette domain-containing protein [Gammaproteobacteria bacterium]
MITLVNVSKRYVTDHVPGPWVLNNVSLTIPPMARVGVVGSKGSGKTTLLRLITGTETPTKGKIERNARIAMPTKYSRSFQPLLTGRQNAKFICRINGSVDDLEERLLAIESLAGLGEKFEKPMNTYTPAMKLSMGFALSVELNFDMYVSDAFNFSGSTAFKNDEAADAAIEKMISHSGIIIASKNVKGEAILKRHCKHGIWLHDGNAEWFDDIDDAIKANRNSQPPKSVGNKISQEVRPENELAKKSLEKIRILSSSLTIVARGLNGSPVVVSNKESARIIKAASHIGMSLLTPEQVAEQGYRIPEGAIPVLKKKTADSGEEIGLYDLEIQCQKTELNA